MRFVARRGCTLQWERRKPCRITIAEGVDACSVASLPLAKLAKCPAPSAFCTANSEAMIALRFSVESKSVSVEAAQRSTARLNTLCAAAS
jgi:hypothetical protein